MKIILINILFALAYNFHVVFSTADAREGLIIVFMFSFFASIHFIVCLVITIVKRIRNKPDWKWYLYTLPIIPLVSTGFYWAGS
jgi:hypothetical protein